MRRLLILALLAAPAFAAEPSKFTLAQSGASADPLTVLGPAGVCADQQIALWSGASNTSLQCSVLTVADTSGNITGPAGGFSIIGGTGAADTLTLDGSAGTAGVLTVGANGAIDALTGISNIRAINTSIGIQVDAGGTNGFQVGYSTSDASMGSTQKFGWTATTAGAALDTGLARSSAGVVKVTDGSTGYGDLHLDDLTIFGTTVPSATDYSGLSIAATDGAVVMGGVTAGTGADDVNVTVKGEGPTATLTLDGSDDVAGSVTVSAAGQLQPSGGLYMRSDQAMPYNIALMIGSAGTSTFYVGNGSNPTGCDAAVCTNSTNIHFTTGGTGVSWEGSSDDTSETLLSATNPTADRTITLPDASGTVALVGFGEIYETGGSTAITITTAGTYYQWATTSVGVASADVTVSAATDDITISQPGTYRITAGCSFAATANALVKFAIHEEGTIQNNCIASRKVSAGGDVGRGAISCLIASVANDSYTLQFTSNTNGHTVTPSECNLNVQRVGS